MGFLPMVNEFLLGLLIQSKTFFNSNPTLAKAETPMTQKHTIPSPSANLISMNIAKPSHIPIKPPVAKKPKPAPTVKPVESETGLTTQSILKALNDYRNKNSIGILQIDDKLQTYAQSRADYLKNIGKLDNHARHQQFMNDGGFEKLGFSAIAENQGWNYRGDSKGLVESFYGKSPGHNKNQLNPEYTHVGIGINGPFTNLVFGGRKR